VPLPENVSFEQGACLGIPGITAHRAVHVAGPVNGRTVLVQGAAGAVGLCAVQLARFAGAHVIGTIRSSADEETATNAGAHEVLLNDAELPARLKAIAPDRWLDERKEALKRPSSTIMMAMAARQVTVQRGVDHQPHLASSSAASATASTEAKTI
jgi:NADPH:quinone reductase-like Zn-dependent oxidoreductase